MKQIVIILLVVISNLNAQWDFVNPRPTINNLNSIFFITNNLGWAAGDFGTLLKTEDGGSTWSKVSNNGTYNFRSVYFFDEINGIALIYRWNNDYSRETCEIRVTEDAGENWGKIYEDSLISLEGIFPVSEFKLFTYGKNGKFLESSDGGINWNKLETGINLTIYDLYAVDSLRIWAACDSGLIIHSLDGGKNWIKQTSKSRGRLTDIKFYSENLGFAIGWYKKLFRTDNGGETWSELSLSSSCNEIYILDTNNVYLAASGAKLLKSSDSGLTWDEIETNFKSWFKISSIYFEDSLNGLIIGDHGSINSTKDGGQNWESISSGWSNRLNSIQFLDNDFGITVGQEGEFRKTTNGGITWKKKSTGTNWELHDVYFVDKKTGYILKDLGKVLKSSDGGNSWGTISTASQNVLISFLFIDSLTAFAVGEQGVITKTINGCQTWDIKYSGYSAAWISDISFVDNIGCAVTDRGRILRSTDYGENWGIVNEYNKFTFSAVEFGNSEIGWIGGSDSSGNSIVLKTTDSGLTWESIKLNDSNLYGNITSLDFISEDVCCAGSEYGLLLTTKDGGETWEIISPSFYSIYSVHAIDEENIWAVGDGGIMLTSSTIDFSTPIIYDKKIIKHNFSLYQNYPNPFNPTTMIGFNILQKNKVIIDVYNVLGQKIKEILNKDIEPGYHEISWDGTNTANRKVSAGIYFYSVKINGYRYSKKMLLLP